MTKDFVVRFLLEDLDIRGAFVRLSDAWRAMQAGRGYAPAVRDLLGEMTAVTVLIGGNLKQPGRIGFQLKGSGPVRLLVIDCTEQLRIRGMAHTDDEISATDAPTLLGHGHLSLLLQHDAVREPYQSIVPLVGQTVAQIFEHYLAQSEQQPARFWLAADGDSAVGLFLQKLPEADAKDADGWTRIEHLAATVSADEMHTLPVEALFTRLFTEEKLRLYTSRSVTYDCPEDRDKVVGMLRSLGREEVALAIAEQGVLVVKDDICNHEYHFDSGDLDELFPPEAPSTLH